MVETRFAQGIDGLGCGCRVRRAVEGRAAAGDGSDAGLDRGCEERGQGVVLHGPRTQHRRTSRQNIRSEISRDQRARRTFRCGADISAHRAGAGQRHQRRRCCQFHCPAHYLDWKKNGWLTPYVPEDVAKHFPADQIDPDGLHATSCAWLEAIGYNTNLVKREDAPKSYADLLDPKWQGKIVKGHPGYSGAIMTATFVLARDLGWPYLEKLAQQKVMQVQSAADPPKKILLGERAVMADGNDYNLVLLKDQGKPVEVVYATEGSPLIIVPSGIFKGAPNPNAAKLFQSFFFSAETQQMLVDVFAHRSFHAQVKEKGEHIPLANLKLLKADPAQVQAQGEEIKARYSKLFGV
jgi:ABC-type Fe3+ transport system substrate-binding protein